MQRHTTNHTANADVPTLAKPSATETAPVTDPTRRYRCRHVFTDGHRCGSPSLRGQDLCYYHTRSRRDAGISGRSGTFPMPRIDDRASLQLALYEVLSRMSGGDIDLKRGTALLNGLRIAVANLPPHPRNGAAQAEPVVEEVTSDYNLGDLAPVAEIVEAEIIEAEPASGSAAPPTSIATSITLVAAHTAANQCHPPNPPQSHSESEQNHTRLLHAVRRRRSQR
jgi:hypothetical protein